MNDFVRKIRIQEFELYKRFINKGDKVLDVGCGQFTLSDKIIEIVGNNNLISIDIINQSKKGFNYINSNFETYEFKEKFDVILFSHSLFHLHSYNGSLAKSKKLLSSRGKIIIVNPTSFWRIHTILAALLNNLLFFFKTKKTLISLPKFSNISSNVYYEIYFFAKFYLDKFYKKNQFNIVHRFDTNITYSGCIFFGSYLPIKYRKKLSRIFGSSSNLTILTNE